MSDRTAAGVFGKDNARFDVACKGEGGEMIRPRQTEHRFEQRGSESVVADEVYELSQPG
jgi:hypothetical protein